MQSFDEKQSEIVALKYRVQQKRAQIRFRLLQVVHLLERLNLLTSDRAAAVHLASQSKRIENWPVF